MKKCLFTFLVLVNAGSALLAPVPSGTRVAEARGYTKPVTTQSTLPAAFPLDPSLAWSRPQAVNILPLLSPDMLQAADKLSAQEHNSRLQIGLSRNLDKPVGINQNAAPSSWSTLPNGWRVASVEVGSAGALGLRLHFENVSLPSGAQIVIYDPAAPTAANINISADAGALARDFWTSTLFAEQAVIECQLPPGTDASSVTFTISGLSHIYNAPVQTSYLKEGSCHKDVSCYPAYANEAAGVAMISYVQGGNTYLCTGCLIASTEATSSEYFLTAHHCVPGQGVASSLEFYWFFQTASCNGTPPSITSVPKTVGGADLLATDTGSDFSLLKLHHAAPGGVSFLGWSVNPPSANEPLVGIHHPDGSYKRISFGKYYATDPDFWAVRWSTGVTEPGSSGSPLLNGSHQIIGQLNGGFDGPGSSCSSPSSPDQYGRFDVTYNAIKRWIDPGSSSGGGGGGGGPVGLAATYYGLFSDGSNGRSPQASGSIAVTTSTKGKFSGKLGLGTTQYSFTGTLNADGTANAVARGGLALQFTIDLAAGGNHLTGTVAGPDWTATIRADRAQFDGRNAISPFLGHYTMVIPAIGGGPGGNSIAVVTVDAKSHLTLSGSLADGTKISQSTYVSADGRWPLYVGLYGGQGSLYSWAQFNGNSGITGSAAWNKPVLLKAKYYKSGFSVVSGIQGSGFARPGLGNPILGFSDGFISLSGGDLPDSISNEILLRSDGKINNLGETKLTLSFSMTTGMFNGSATDPATKRSLPFHGVVLQNQNVGSGYFTTTDQSGEVSVQP